MPRERRHTAARRGVPDIDGLGAPATVIPVPTQPQDGNCLSAQPRAAPMDEHDVSAQGFRTQLSAFIGIALTNHIETLPPAWHSAG